MSATGKHQHASSKDNDQTTTIEQIYSTFARHLYENNSVKICTAYLKQSNITNAERVLFVTKFLEEFKLFTKLSDVEKSNELSVQFRENGNLAFKKKQYNEALESYNKSIAYAEVTKNTENLAFAYGNRSAVLFELNFLEECLMVRIYLLILTTYHILNKAICHFVFSNKMADYLIQHPNY